MKYIGTVKCNYDYKGTAEFSLYHGTTYYTLVAKHYDGRSVSISMDDKEFTALKEMINNA